MLAETERAARQRGFAHRLPEVAVAQVLALLRLGQAAAAAEKAQAHDLPLSQARVHLAQSDPAAALQALEPWRRKVAARGWPDETLKLQVLQAVAFQALGEQAQALHALREALAPDCLALTLPAEPTLVRMPNVQHLHTPVDGVLRRDACILDLVERLHPTPAVGGVPQGTILERIRACEEFDRGWYAGPVGWVDARGGGDFAIAIRSALMTSLAAGPSGVRLYAGCGIVAASDPEAEYRELRLKLRPLAWGTEAVELAAADGGERPSDRLALG